MVVDRDAGTIEHRQFSELAAPARAARLLVVNTIARLARAAARHPRRLGRARRGLPAHAARRRPLRSDGAPGGKLKPGRSSRSRPASSSRSPRSRSAARASCGCARIRLRRASDRAHGHMPLPPYIARSDEAADVERYQTVYARERRLGRGADGGAALHARAARRDRRARRAARRGGAARGRRHVQAGGGRRPGRPRDARGALHDPRDRRGARSRARRRRPRLGRGHDDRAHAGERGRRRRVACAPAAARRGSSSARRALPRRRRLVTNFHLPRSTLHHARRGVRRIRPDDARVPRGDRERYRFYSYGDAMAII